MMNELLDVSKHIDPETRTTLVAVSTVMSSLSIENIVVGATARDLVLHLGHGTPVARATRDIDYAIQIDSWNSFFELKHELLKRSFLETKAEHRFNSPNGMPIDIIPFGNIERGNSEIAWPPEGNPVMNMRGFQEASASAARVLVSESPLVECRVVSPEGLALLKFIAWLDRSKELRSKDANDIRYLLSTYRSIKNIKEEIYSDTHAPYSELYEWDPDLAACRLLGTECRSIAFPETISEISTLFAENGRLVELVGEISDGRPGYNIQLLEAFADGLLNRKQPGQP